PDPVTAQMDLNEDIDVAAFSSSILASLLEVDINEGSEEAKAKQSVSPCGSTQKKQPRKKTTNRPNPTLLNLKRRRMEDIKRTDPKLKMNVVVRLRRAEEDFEVARKWVKEHNRIVPPEAKDIDSEEGDLESPVQQEDKHNDSDKTDKDELEKGDSEAEVTLEVPPENSEIQAPEEHTHVTESKETTTPKDTDSTENIDTDKDKTETCTAESIGATKDTEVIESAEPMEVVGATATARVIENTVDESAEAIGEIEKQSTANTELEEAAKSDPDVPVTQADEEEDSIKTVAEETLNTTENVVDAEDASVLPVLEEETTTNTDASAITKTDTEKAEALTTEAEDAITLATLLDEIDTDTDEATNAESRKSPEASDNT
ncbi:hypothetical protein KR222_003296, partial [Zaprionus bogoriensis]